jgi:flavin-dependent dehydrogenase
LQAAPISYFYSEYNFDNIYSVDEAAGLTGYFSGGGIPNSIFSGSDFGFFFRQFLLFIKFK